MQFRKNPADIQKEIEIYTRDFAPLPVTLSFKNIFYDSIDWSNPKSICEDADALIFGGSGDLFFDGGLCHDDQAIVSSCTYAKLHEPLFKYLFAHHIPTLGICFGHQMLAYTHGVQVRNDTEQAKTGSHEVVLTEEGRMDPLFAGIPSQFTAQYGHRDSISSLPDGAVLLAYGEQCRYSAVRLGPKRYSLQFHPELIADDMRRRCADNPTYLPPGTDINTAIRESDDASKVLHNFVFNIMHAGATEEFIEEEIAMQENRFTTEQVLCSVSSNTRSSY